VKLILPDPARHQLFALLPEEFSQSSSDKLRGLEQRLLFTRITLVFGWSKGVGKLAIARVVK